MPSDFYQSVAVQRRDRDEVEDSERYIEETELYPEIDHDIYFVEIDIVRRTAHDFHVDQHHEDTDDRQNQIRCRSRERYHEFSFAWILIIERIDLHGFSSSEMRDKDHKESYGIDMFERIRRQSSLQFRRRISETIGNICMRVFMHSDGYGQDDGQLDDFKNPHNQKTN